MRNINTILLAAVTSALVAGCSTMDGITVQGSGLQGGAVVAPSGGHAELDGYLADKPAELQEHYRTLFLGGPRNAVLNQLRIGLAAMELGYFEESAAAFDGALQRIEQVYANDPNARLAKSKWHAETVKDFKGEPYERAMAYFYRGLLYLREGDYENARASFLAGEFQDSVAESDEFSADFAVLNYLAGWASHCAGDAALAERYYGEASRHNPSLVAAPARDNLLLIADAGAAPLKTGGGKYKERLEFRPNPASGDLSAVFHLVGSGSKPGSQRIPATEATDVFWQASTRGGRPIEAILNGKAEFKDGTQVAAEVGNTVAQLAIQQGAILGDNNMMFGGLAAGLFSIGASMISQATQPAADTRYWDNLPDAILVATTVAPAGDYGIEAEFRSPDSSPGTRRVPTLRAAAGRCQVAWVRSDPAAAIPPVAPGSELTSSQAKKLARTRAQADQAFRASLLTAKSE